MRFAKQWVLRSAALAAVALAVLSGGLAFASTSASASDNAFVRAIHASTKLDKVDIFIDGKEYRKDFAFAAISDIYNYDAVPSGKHTVQIAAAGKGVDAAVIKKEVTLEPGTAYTLAAVGTDDSNLELLVFTDNNLVPPQQGLSKARLYHLSPDSDNLNAQISGVPTPINNIKYKTATDYFFLPAGKYTITGSTTDGKKVPFDITLEADQVSSAFVVGLSNGEPRLQLVGTRITAIPGLPATGSNPNAQPESQGTLLWSIVSAVMAVAAISLLAVQWFRRPRTTPVA